MKVVDLRRKRGITCKLPLQTRLRLPPPIKRPLHNLLLPDQIRCRHPELDLLQNGDLLNRKPFLLTVNAFLS